MISTRHFAGELILPEIAAKLRDIRTNSWNVVNSFGSRRNIKGHHTLLLFLLVITGVVERGEFPSMSGHDDIHIRCLLCLCTVFDFVHLVVACQLLYGCPILRYSPVAILRCRRMLVSYPIVDFCINV